MSQNIRAYPYCWHARYERPDNRCLHRGLVPEERIQVMGNRREVYERYCMPNFIDCNTLAVYLGTPPATI